MNALTTTAPERRLSPVEVYCGTVLPPDSPALLALPAGVDPRRFRHSLQIAVMQNPALLKVDPRLTFREVAKASSLGLFLDPGLGEAYLVITLNRKTQRDEPQLRTGYRGLMKLSRQSGEIANLYAQIVYSNDPFDVSFGDEPRLFHKPDVFGDRGEPVGAYAFARFKDGSFDFEPMSMRQIHAIRDLSDGWKAFRAGRIKATPWSAHPEEMARKTVLRRLLKRLPQSPELVEAQRIDDAAEPLEGAIEPPKPSHASQPRGGTGAPQTDVTANPDPDEFDEADINDMTGQGGPTNGKDDAGIDEETGEVLSTSEGDSTTPSAELATPPADTGEYEIDPGNPDYGRGVKDFNEGRTKCISATIREDAGRFAHWQAGQEAARYARESKGG